MIRLFIASMSVLATVAAVAVEGEYHKATRLGKPETKIMGCPAGGFWDPRNGGECWTCGDNKRGIAPVDSDQACIVTPKTRFAAATRHESNKTSCAGSSFFDISTGSCWSCPTNYKRTVFSIHKGKACERRIPRKNAKATYSHTTKSLLDSCGKGHFANVGSRKCYECKSGWKHDHSKTVGKSGVCYQPARTVHARASQGSKPSLSCSKGFYDPIDGGSCWTCPSGFERHVTSIKDEKACIGVSAPGTTGARFLKAHAPDAIEVARGVNDLGCRAHGKRAFFDLKDGGSCWSCPSSHPKRTLYAVHKGKACATNVCGQEGGRPCFVWERIPSCNDGLVEDPFKNQCARPKNLACVGYVKSLAGIREAIETANRTGSALQEEAFDAIPGAEALINFAMNQVSQAQEQLERAMPEVDTSKIAEPFVDLLMRDPKFIENLVTTVEIVAGQTDRFADFMTDPDQVCSGDLSRLVSNLKGQGLYDAFRDTEPAAPSKPTRINLGQLGGSMYPAGLLGPSFADVQLAALTDQVGRMVGGDSRNRLIIDFTAEFPVKGTIVSPGIQIAIPLGSGAEPGVYVMLGGYGGGNKVPNEIAELTKGGLYTTNIGVGFQWGGLKKHTGNRCMTSNVAGLGVAMKLGGVLGFGFNPECAVSGAPENLFGGFSFSVGSANWGKLEPLLTTVKLMALPDGTVVAKHPYQKRFQRVKRVGQFMVGPEASFRLAPHDGSVRRIGSVH